jgi:hypothetical protein
MQRDSVLFHPRRQRPGHFPRPRPRAECRSDHRGGRNARLHAGRREVTERCRIEPVIEPCSRHGGRDPGTHCGPGRSDRPGIGSSREPPHRDIHPTDRSATCRCNNTAATCPDCTTPPSCPADPCSHSTRPAYPRAERRPDHRGGRNARLHAGRREVTERCRIEPVIEPCSRHGGRDPGTHCGIGSSRECPGSSHRDIQPPNRFAKCCCNDTAATCRDCTRPINCSSVDPCRNSNCPLYPSASCRSDGCGGCNAQYLVGRTVEITRLCDISERYG